jgi:ABC-2 type transport system permease protein
MSGAVFFETIRRSWRGTVLWALGLASLGAMVILLIPNSDTLKQYGDLLQTMPPFLLNMFGTDAQFAATPEGFLSVGFFGRLTIITTVYAVLAGLNITAAEEDRGIMDVVLSLPVARWRVVVEKLVAYTLLSVLIGFGTFLGIWLPMQTSTVFTISTGRLFETCMNVVPNMLIVMTMTALVATVVRRRAVATAVAAVIVVASYFLDTMGAIMGESADLIRGLSFFSYFDSVELLQNGTAWVSAIGLLVVAFVLAAGAVFAFNRRDVGV